MPRLLLAALMLAAVPSSAFADVVEAGTNGFAIKLTAEVNAPASTVFRALTAQVGRWWDPEHTYSGSAANLSLDPRPGGCFCETLPTGGVQHMMVTHVLAPKTLILVGALGPLGPMGVTGAMEWTLEERSGHTLLQMTYNVGGFTPGGFAPIAPAVDRVLAGQVRRLKTYAETGRPD
jgi:uncharacterized protein YndB with AHSA1/START domain